MNAEIIDGAYVIAEQQDEILVFLNGNGDITVSVGEELNVIPMSHAPEIAEAILQICKDERVI